MDKQNNKVVAIIQARMGSSRLPGKVAKAIKGQAMLAHLIKRLKHAKLIDQLVIATSRLKDDDQVAEIARREKVGLYRGSETNVLSRYLEAAQQYDADIIIRITGDCPLIAPEIVDQAITVFLDKEVDYLRLDVGKEGYPRGLDTEVFYYSTLLEAAAYIAEAGYEANSPYREHVTLYIYKHPEQFLIACQQPPTELQRGYRLCVDEVADLQLISQIYERLYKEGKIIDIKQAIELLDNDPGLAMLNKDVAQKKV